jgi:deoxyribonuclease V
VANNRDKRPVPWSSAIGHYQPIVGPLGGAYSPKSDFYHIFLRRYYALYPLPLSIAPPQRYYGPICQWRELAVIIVSVDTKRIHRWNIGIAEARALQQRLSRQVVAQGEVAAPRLIAGVDVAAGGRGRPAKAAVVVLDYPGLQPVEVVVEPGELELPYIPGLLSFRECPLLLQAFARLSCTPDMIMVDGQGMAHPRRMGLACHLGLFLEVPTIGCAKSRLCGQHQTPDEEAGSYTELYDDEEVIGAVVRTRTGVKPVYVSSGHRISLPNAIHWVLQCGKGYHLPEPTRLAHLAAAGRLEVKPAGRVSV